MSTHVVDGERTEGVPEALNWNGRAITLRGEDGEGASSHLPCLHWIGFARSLRLSVYRSVGRSVGVDLASFRPFVCLSVCLRRGREAFSRPSVSRSLWCGWPTREGGREMEAGDDARTDDSAGAGGRATRRRMELDMRQALRTHARSLARAPWPRRRWRRRGGRGREGAEAAQEMLHKQS